MCKAVLMVNRALKHYRDYQLCVSIPRLSRRLWCKQSLTVESYPDQTGSDVSWPSLISSRALVMRSTKHTGGARPVPVFRLAGGAHGVESMRRNLAFIFTLRGSEVQ